ncbi:MAG: efflux RND transporter periplasmic adaptor subunit [Marinobacter sp.]
MRFALLVALVAIAFIAGWLSRPYVLPEVSGTAMNVSSELAGKEAPLYWVAPMDPNYRRDKPGQSPMGMDLVPVYDDNSVDNEDGGVSINSQIRANLGVKTGAVTRGAVAVPVSTVGYVTDNEDQLTLVHSRISGWVEMLHVKSVGESVEKSEPLFEIYSPELVNAQQEFLLALRVSSGPVAEASGNKLRALGMTDAQIASLKKNGKALQRITMFAPSSGYVTSLNARAGMYIRPDTEIMAIGSRDSVWIIAEFFERQAGLVKAGQTVRFTTPALPNTEWQGTIDYVYPELDPRTRSLQARIRVPNTEGTLRPNMFVQLTMDAPIGENLLTVPRSALIQRTNSQHVLVAEGDGYFRPAPVRIGQEVGNRMVIIDGLNEGQRVVTSAQFLIDSETNLDEALLRFESGQTSASSGIENAAAAGLITGVGRISELDLGSESASITLNHGPITELSWPAMTMAFGLSESVSTDGLAIDQEVTFRFRETPEGYVIEGLTTTPKPQQNIGE